MLSLTNPKMPLVTLLKIKIMVITTDKHSGYKTSSSGEGYVADGLPKCFSIKKYNSLPLIYFLCVCSEIATRSAHGLESDVWSLGCMLYTFLTGRPPFDVSHNNICDMIRQIGSDVRHIAFVFYP